MGYSVIETSEGGYALAGTTGNNCWLVKTDAAGNVEWNQTYGGGGFRSLVATFDNGYALAGTTNPFGLDAGDVWLVKTDSLGNIEWNKTYVESGYIEVRSLIEASDGGYAIAGTTAYSFGGDAGGYNFGLIKTDSLGNMEWNQTYGGTGADYGYFLVETSDGGYAIAGTRDCSFILIPRGTSWLVKTDSLGNMEWNRTYTEEHAHWTCSLIATSDGGYAMASYAYLENNAGIVLIKTDEFGVVPEAAWIILPLLVIATFSVFISKKKLLRQFQ